MASAVPIITLKANIKCCSSCPKKVHKKLSKIHGVTNVDVDAETGLITVTGARDASILIKAVKKAVGRNADFFKFEMQGDQGSNSSKYYTCDDEEISHDGGHSSRSNNNRSHVGHSSRSVEHDNHSHVGHSSRSIEHDNHSHAGHSSRSNNNNHTFPGPDYTIRRPLSSSNPSQQGYDPYNYYQPDMPQQPPHYYYHDGY